jgi:hypothetical protein
MRLKPILPLLEPLLFFEATQPLPNSKDGCKPLGLAVIALWGALTTHPF